MSSQKKLWNDTARYESALDQAVRYLAKLSKLVRIAIKEADKAVSGKNVVVRTNSAAVTQKTLKELTTETEHWNHVIETMKSGKDVHVQENCKGSKLEIVAGSEYEFGQYLIDQSNGKFCEQYPIDVRGNRAGHKYINKVTDETTEPYNANELRNGKYE